MDVTAMQSVAPATKFITVTPSRAIRWGGYDATPQQDSLVTQAVRDFGFLLSSRGPQEYALTEFADLINEVYDAEHHTRIRAIVRALLDVQIQTEARARH